MDGGVLDLSRALLLRDVARQRLVKTVSVLTPGAGVELTQVAPGGVVWEILSVKTVLTTGGAVANRVPQLRVTDQDGVEIERYNSGVTQTATATQVFTFAAGLGAVVSGVSAAVPIPNPPLLVLAGWSLATITSGFQAADQYSAAVLKVREWTEWGAMMFSEQIAEQMLEQSVLP